MKKTHTALLMGASMLLATSLAWAEGPAGGERPHRGPKMHCAPALNLTDAQKTKIKAIREKYRGQRQELHKKMEAEVSSVLTREQREQVAKMREARAKRMAWRRTAPRPGGPRANARRLSQELNLTPKQEQKLQEIRNARRAEMRSLFQDARSGKVTRDQARERAQALREKTTRQMNDVLTRDQQQKLKSLREQWGACCRK
ncbi:MAG: hypothetical protein GX785_13585 [Armatimonadetes bacterium]|jgi:Spy/CpxP family protein refolding chaperone|nr:hypothetical protein [Armatimonadota bacterium]